MVHKYKHNRLLIYNSVCLIGQWWGDVRVSSLECLSVFCAGVGIGLPGSMLIQHDTAFIGQASSIRGVPSSTRVRHLLLFIVPLS